MQDLPKKSHNIRTILFVITICFVCALILSLLASALKKPQEEAKELYKSKQLLVAARILTYEGRFSLRLSDGTYVPATFDKTSGILVPWKENTPAPLAKNSEILQIYQSRITPMLTDANGNVFTFEQAGINLTNYISENEKYGFSDLTYKLFYLIQSNEESVTPYGYGIPINGYGLWDAIYGFIVLESNADTVIGITWYDQKETPGLGGNIALPSFQDEFRGKVIFKEDARGQTNYEIAPMGIRILKGTVKDELGDRPAAKSAIDGIAGATITSNGVTEAYRNCLTPYRNFLMITQTRQQ